jgi:hypothetical protein
MEDFYQSEFRINPVPDNVVAITKTNPIYTLTAIARFQANELLRSKPSASRSSAGRRSYAHLRKSNLLPGAKAGLRTFISTSRAVQASTTTKAGGSILFTNSFTQTLILAG